MLMLHHAPRSRSTGILWLLEELAVPFDVHHVDIRGSVAEEYRRIHPHKKVPALQDGDTIVTERAAICLYLCEKFPKAGLAPPIGDAQRAAFLSERKAALEAWATHVMAAAEARESPANVVKLRRA